jgi:transcriptional repressor of cell division inhibition gene dicB
MTTSEAIKHFGSSKELARALGIDWSAVRHWGAYPPVGRQAQLQVMTAGKLRAEPFGGQRD